MTEAERDAYHAEKMKKKKEARNKILATKTEERGLLIVHTGKGKGKSTAAFGMVFRCHRPRLQGRRGAVRQGRLGHRASATCWKNSPIS
jgi:ATP:corrinoid adenosyltransferase